jgi:hypothetical protein
MKKRTYLWVGWSGKEPPEPAPRMRLVEPVSGMGIEELSQQSVEDQDDGALNSRAQQVHQACRARV